MEKVIASFLYVEEMTLSRVKVTVVPWSFHDRKKQHIPMSTYLEWWQAEQKTMKCYPVVTLFPLLLKLSKRVS